MSAAGSLSRVVGVPGAVLLGLGSIVGTGIFVSIGVAAGVAGPGVIAAVALAAVVATFNGLSSAQLAASHPVSGGTYEYGYRYLSPALGHTAGWMFLCAKSASAATAALGFAGYVLAALGRSAPAERTALGLALVVVLTAVVAGGMRRSSRANAVIVGFTLLALLAFVVAGIARTAGTTSGPLAALASTADADLAGLLHGTALMFVAYTGYGRIATLGEEVREPRTSIPRAIVLTLLATMLLYVAVAVAAVSVAGTGGLAAATADAAAPLELIAARLPVPGVAWLVGAAAITAMAGVLLNLLLGLSRVLLAMARRGDMPAGLAAVEDGSPRHAVIAVGAFIAALVLLGDVETTWSFSAFTVLVYYALTNLAALRLPPEDRRYPRWISAAGLVSCLGLAFWVDPTIWGVGLGVLAVGAVWHLVARRARR